MINFLDWSEDKARSYPDCFDIVERLVKPERFILKDKGGKEKWWQFLRSRKELYATISDADCVKSPVLLWAGTGDKNANPEQTRSLYNALRKYRKPVVALFTRMNSMH